MNRTCYPPLPSAEARLLETLGAAQSLLMDLRHFAANPDVPLQSNPPAYLRWNRKLGTHPDIAQLVLPIWCGGVTERMNFTGQTLPSMSEESPIPGTQKIQNGEEPRAPLEEIGWNPDDPETLEVIRRAVEPQQRFPVQVSASVDQETYDFMRRHKGGVTGFINEALENYLVNPPLVLVAAGQLAGCRKASSCRIAVTGRITEDLSRRIHAIQEALATKVARISVSKIVGGSIYLLFSNTKVTK